MIGELVDDFTSCRPMSLFEKTRKGSLLCTWLMQQHAMVLPAQVQSAATLWSLLAKGKGFDGTDFQPEDAKGCCWPCLG